jgi:hypothetical protein
LLNDSSLPEDFESQFPGAKRDASTGKYKAYGLFRCIMLAHSPQNQEALNKADSITGIVLFLDYIAKNPDMRLQYGIPSKIILVDA